MQAIRRFCGLVLEHRKRLAPFVILIGLLVVGGQLYEAAPRQTDIVFRLGPDHRQVHEVRITYLLDETQFLLDESISLILGPDETLSGGVEDTARQFQEGTEEYWKLWVRKLALPFEWLAPTPRDWALFILLGLLGSVTMWFMTLAYRHAPAAVVAPFDYTILLWGLLLGWLIWHELPDPEIWPGAVLLIGCGLYITHRETRLARRKPKDGEDAPATGI